MVIRELPGIFITKLLYIILIFSVTSLTTCFLSTCLLIATIFAMIGLSNNKLHLLLPHISLSIIMLCFHFGFCASWLNDWWLNGHQIDGDLLILGVAALLFETILLSASELTRP